LAPAVIGAPEQGDGPGWPRQWSDSERAAQSALSELSSPGGSLALSEPGVARAVVNGAADRGIVLGGSGQGEQIAANKVDGCRAALCNDLYTARMSRQHNDANVLAIGARVVAAPLAMEITRLWLETPCEGGRHAPRLEQIAAIERGEI